MEAGLAKFHQKQSHGFVLKFHSFLKDNKDDLFAGGFGGLAWWRLGSLNFANNSPTDSPLNSTVF